MKQFPGRLLTGTSAYGDERHPRLSSQWMRGPRELMSSSWMSRQRADGWLTDWLRRRTVCGGGGAASSEGATTPPER